MKGGARLVERNLQGHQWNLQSQSMPDKTNYDQQVAYADKDFGYVKNPPLWIIKGDIPAAPKDHSGFQYFKDQDNAIRTLIHTKRLLLALLDNRLPQHLTNDLS
jgi:hypothetical protein